jgi:hypothetical protein
LGSLSAGLLLEACAPKGDVHDTPAVSADVAVAVPGREPFEVERDRQLNAKTFFSPDELQCITLLGDIIIPRDAHSGNASDAKVPAFIEFIVKDMPEHQVPIRGGLRWLNLRSLKHFNKSFASVTDTERIALVEEIAWPEKSKPEVSQGVSFFNHIRGLVATGFFTTEMGIKDLGYVGNKPNVWLGVPPEIVKQYGLEGV